MSGPTDTVKIDLQPDERDKSGLQVDTATLVAAQIFGSPALPKGIPAVKAEFITAAANAAQRVDTAGLTLGGAFGGPLGEPTREERKRKIEEDALEYMSDAADRAEHARELEREREAWAHTRSTVGNVTMTGAEWAQFAERLRNDDELRRRLIEKFESEGATLEEAKTRVDRAAAAADAASIPPSQRTAEQKRLLNTPQVGADLDAANTLRRELPLIPRSELGETFSTAAANPQTEIASQPTASAVARPVVTAPGMGF